MTTWQEHLGDVWEDAKVRWFMLDAQQKQAVILLGVYAAYTLLDIGGAVVSSRLKAGT